MTTDSIQIVFRSISLAIVNVAFAFFLALRSSAQDVPSQPVADLESRVRLLEGRVKQLEAADSPRVPKLANESVRRADNIGGVWVNVDGETRGITQVSIADNAENGSTVQVWGACQPTPCDWGVVKLHRLGDNVAARELPYGFAHWDHGFTDTYFTMHIEGNELVVESYDIFKDNSGRSNYRSVARFRRDAANKIESVDVNRTVPQNSIETGTSLLAPPLPPRSASRDARALVRPMGGAHTYRGDDSWAVYITSGGVDEASTLLQVDWTGKVLSGLELPYSTYGIAADQGRLVATVASARVGQARVISVAADGSVNTVFRDKSLLTDTIGIWSTPESKEILVVDNGADVIVSVPKDGKTPARKLIQITGHPDYQSMSVAKSADGSLLYSGSDFKSVFRIPPGSGTELGEPLLIGDAAVAADPHSQIWVAALEDELHVFKAEREIARLSYPGGLTMFRSNIAFARDGVLIIALHGAGRYYVYAVNLDTKVYDGLFSVDSDRLTGMTIAPRLDWKSAANVDAAK